ncbi:MAG: ribosomal protein S18-alanine N-acetyltransferase [Elusimicrobia bacterium]|nr:ribosomal protein S18-alanine N-acetyltransferase [Elusimicrobiota bacterium]
MSALRARKALESDLDAVLAIEAAWPTTPKWSRDNFMREIKSERAYFCVCEDAGGVSGYGGIWLLPPEAQVTTLAIRPDVAGRGFGASLLEHLESHARERGCAMMTLEVSAANERALRLYRRRGYAIVGRRAKYYNDGSDALLMTRRFFDQTPAVQ